MANLLSRIFTRSNSSQVASEGTAVSTASDYTIAAQPRTNHSGFSSMQAARYFRYGTFPDISTDDLPDPVFRPINKFSIWVAPNPSFADMLNAYENDPEIMFGIDFCTAVTVGSGHYFSGESERVTDYLTDFAEDLNLDFIASTAARETLAYGNSIWRYQDFFNKPTSEKFDVLEQMPLTAMKRIWWNGWRDDSTIGFYEFRGYKIDRLLPSELVHFRWRVSNASPYGLGAIAPLVQKVDYKLNRNGTDTTYTRMSYVDIKRSIEDSTHKVLKRYINRNVFKAPGASPQQVSAIQSAIDSLSDEQDFVVPAQDFDVLQLGSASRTIDLETFTAVYQNPIIKALGTPVSRLFEKGALTEASAESAKEAALMALVGFQRQMKRQMERQILKVWYDANPTVDANGVVIPWKLAKPQLHWGEPEKPEINVADLVRAKPEAFSIKDIRQMAYEAGAEIDVNELPSAQEQQMSMQQKMNSLMFGGSGKQVGGQF